MQYNYKEDYDKDYSDKELLSKFWSYLRKHKVKLVAIIILILVGAGLNILPPLMVQKAFDVLEAKQQWTVVFPYALAYVILSFILWLIQVFNGILLIQTTQKVIKDIQVDTFVSLQEHDLVFYDKQSTGKIMSRITNDAQELNQMIGLIGQFISNFVILFAVLAIMFTVNWRLTLVTLAMGPVVIATGVLFRKIIRKTSGSWRAAIGEVNAAFQESVAGIAIAKAFGREKKSKEEFNVINEKTFQYAKRRAFAITGIWPVMDGISILGVFGITLFGSWLIFEGLGTASTILLFILLLNRFLYPLMRVASQISIIQSGFAAMERIFSIIDHERKVVNKENPVQKEIIGKVTFEHVYHEYEPNSPVLEDINLEIEPGETIAIVGHTGAGKTTIASLLMRFYDISKGSIKIDDVDIRDYDIKHLRKNIGLVSQDVFLFSGTVLDNIRFGNPNATLEEVKQVIEIVAAQEFIDALPNGLNTEIGERGKGLSLGQRQMISFARTLITNPKIVILDEATAAVDAYTEWKIQEALDKLLQNRTSIVIAHRLTTIQNADRIIVLDHGKIIEEGTHETLLSKGGFYAELYNTYFKHQSAEWIAEMSTFFEKT